MQYEYAKEVVAEVGVEVAAVCVVIRRSIFDHLESTFTINLPILSIRLSW